MEKYIFTEILNLPFFNFHHVVSCFDTNRMGRADVPDLYSNDYFMYFHEGRWKYW